MLRTGGRGHQARHRRDDLPEARRSPPKRGDLRPHKTKYWLTSKDKLEDPEQYEADVRKVCETYADAPRLAAEGGHSTDEKTGIQALERIHATKPTRPGLTERIEFEYKRHMARSA